MKPPIFRESGQWGGRPFIEIESPEGLRRRVYSPAPAFPHIWRYASHKRALECASLGSGGQWGKKDSPRGSGKRLAN